MKFDVAVQNIQTFLAKHQPQLIQSEDLKPAAILIPFFEKAGEAHLLLTRRTDTVEHHKGQISFPGGSVEQQDAALIDTALRETEEEVGIPPQLVDPLGQLDDFPTMSQFMISPFIATIPYPHPRQISPDEVAEVLEVPLSLFLTDRYFELKQLQYQGKKHMVYFYTYGENTIWGVTGHIIHRMIEQIFSYSPVSSQRLR